MFRRSKIRTWNFKQRPPISCVGYADGQHGLIRQALDTDGVLGERDELKAADRDAMPSELAKIDAVVFFRSFYSKKASVPTKLGELLAAGIQCLTAAGIGDVDEILACERVGIVAQRPEQELRRQVSAELVQLAREPRLAERCRAAAIRQFSLDAGVRACAELYDTLAAS